MRLDYPLKDSLCVSWYILLALLIGNAMIKSVIFRLIFVKPRNKYLRELRYLRNASNIKTYTYLTLPNEDKNQLLSQYQTMMYSYLCHIVPNDIALLIIGLYLPLKHLNQSINSDNDSINCMPNDDKLHIEMTPIQPSVDKHFIDFESLKKWCDDNKDTSDFDEDEAVKENKIAIAYRGRTRKRSNVAKAMGLGTSLMIMIESIMNEYYMPDFNQNCIPISTLNKMKTLNDKQHIPKLLETVYVGLKNIMSFISTIIMMVVFSEWCNDTVTTDIQKYQFKRFIGFVILFYYHPSMTCINIMRYTKIDGLGGGKTANLIMCCPLLLFFIYPCMIGIARNNERDLYFDKVLKLCTMINFYINVYGIWLISVPFVVTGGFYYISIMWLVYLILFIGGLILYCFMNVICSMCGITLKYLIIMAFPWAMTFVYHTTSIMYIIGLIAYGMRGSSYDTDRLGDSWQKAFFGTYCSKDWNEWQEWSYIGRWFSFNWSDWRIVWIVISWML